LAGGADLSHAVMKRLGVYVPPGFRITTVTKTDRYVM
jgi:hypothetical protein